MPSAWNFFIPSSFGKLHTFPSRFSPSRRRRPSMGSQGRTWGIGRGREGKEGGNGAYGCARCMGGERSDADLRGGGETHFSPPYLGGKERGVRTEWIEIGGDRVRRIFGWGEEEKEKEGRKQADQILIDGKSCSSSLACCIQVFSTAVRTLALTTYNWAQANCLAFGFVVIRI